VEADRIQGNWSRVEGCAVKEGEEKEKGKGKGKENRKSVDWGAHFEAQELVPVADRYESVLCLQSMQLVYEKEKIQID
jgi:hypothetical protein